MFFGNRRSKAIISFLFYFFFSIAVGLDFSDSLSRYLIDVYVQDKNEVVLVNSSRESQISFMPFAGVIRWHGFSVMTSMPGIYSLSHPVPLSSKQIEKVTKNESAALALDFDPTNQIRLSSSLLQLDSTDHLGSMSLNLLIDSKDADSFPFPLVELSCATKLPSDASEIAISDLWASLLIEHGFESNGVERHPTRFEDIVQEQIDGLTIVGIYETGYSQSRFFNAKKRLNELMEDNDFASFLTKNPSAGSLLRYGDFQTSSFLFRPTKDHFADYAFLKKVGYQHPFRGLDGSHTSFEVVLSSFWFTLAFYTISLLLLIILLIQNRKNKAIEASPMDSNSFWRRWGKALLPKLLVAGLALTSSEIAFVVLDVCLSKCFVTHTLPSVLILLGFAILTSLCKAIRKRNHLSNES